MSLCLLEHRDMVISGLAVFAASFMLLSQYWLTNLSLLGPISLASILIALTAFMAHELMHRYVARRLGYIACFRLVKYGLVMLLVTALIGLAARSPFMMGAPGAVAIGPNILGKENSKYRALIALAGPGTNVIMAALFYALTLPTVNNAALLLVLRLTYILNSILALFNSLPIPPLDGYQVVKNREYGLWLTLMVSSILVSIPALGYLL
ncbi:peptidase M50 [Caldivirga maquilingensis]|uniref:Peptidase M50 n=1 Tax=Caldivirga maquilingensis (strain ATCC 700844 / DSM 13496 / JCM 10307 / IC-167) TaxID=397948 RepID=A8MCM5_CALMQ|nr:peptidase M50 [Caldivirga maquilingensis]ABW01531.1 peptidase M50 [Caldivirga maquilingensis IC-167]